MKSIFEIIGVRRLYPNWTLAQLVDLRQNLHLKIDLDLLEKSLKTAKKVVKKSSYLKKVFEPVRQIQKLLKKKNLLEVEYNWWLY